MLSSRKANAAEVVQSGLIHRVYVPESAQRPLATVVLVHGRAGNDRVMWLFSKALEGIRPLVVAPQALLDDPVGGFSWWAVSHPQDIESPLPKKTSLTDLAEPLQQLETFIESLPELYGADPAKIFAFGFSQGAALLASLSIRNPDLLKGVALLSGFLPGVLHQELDDEPPAKQLPSYFIAHGSKDEIIPFERAEMARDALLPFAVDVQFHSDTVGHKIGSSGIRALRAWVEQQFADSSE